MMCERSADAQSMVVEPPSPTRRAELCLLAIHRQGVLADGDGAASWRLQLLRPDVTSSTVNTSTWPNGDFLPAQMSRQMGTSNRPRVWMASQSLTRHQCNKEGTKTGWRATSATCESRSESGRHAKVKLSRASQRAVLVSTPYKFTQLPQHRASPTSLPMLRV